MSLSERERTRYARHLALAEIGPAGQERLRAARVLVVGAGGLGSPAALYLAAAGCGTLGLLDSDRVELSNLQRQVLFDAEVLEQSKAEAGAARLAALNGEIRVRSHALELDAGNARALVAEYDVVLDGSDRLGTRYLVNDACVLERRALVTAAVHRFEGQLLTYVPDRGPCYRCLFPQARDGLVANCATAGVLGVLPGVLGTLQATEALKLITGVGEALTGRLLTYDALGMRFAEFRVPRRRDCAVCGDHPSITDLKDSLTVNAPTAADGVRHLAPTDLEELLRAGGTPPLLVDVREPYEYEAGHLPGSLHIPLAQLPQRLPELAGKAAPVFICRSGGRSLAACRMALAARIASPGNLEGGLTAWAQQIDPSLRVA